MALILVGTTPPACLPTCMPPHVLPLDVATLWLTIRPHVLPQHVRPLHMATGRQLGDETRQLRQCLGPLRGHRPHDKLPLLCQHPLSLPCQLRLHQLWSCRHRRQFPVVAWPATTAYQLSLVRPVLLLKSRTWRSPGDPSQ